MPRENDLEGVQDQGGKHGGQKGMPEPGPRPPHGSDQVIMRDQKGEEQPRDKERAQQVSRKDRGGRPAGRKSVSLKSGKAAYVKESSRHEQSIREGPGRLHRGRV